MVDILHTIIDFQKNVESIGQFGGIIKLTIFVVIVFETKAKIKNISIVYHVLYSSGLGSSVT